MNRKPGDDVRKAVEAVVGDRYDPPRRAAATLARWLAALVLAAGAVALIVWILHRHVRDAQTAPAPQKPVPVRIVPAPPP